MIQSINKKAPSKLLLKDNYLSMIENACGSEMWANAYGIINGKRQDILDNGSVSCAYFVSSILKIFDLIKTLHLTVQGTEKDLIILKWKQIPINSKIPVGSVLIWERKDNHSHIGFYLGKEKAISLWTYHNFPIIHHWTYNNSRKVIKAYYNSKIKN